MEENKQIALTNVYDMNKSLISQTEKILRGKALSNKIENTIVPFINDMLDFNIYFMLLCHEFRDYTIFRAYTQDAKRTAEELIDCLKNRGDIFAIDNSDENKNALEIWIRSSEDNEMYCYYFFPGDDFVIEV